MIPLKLQLKNFLSYGSDVQTVDFSNHQLICLSGKNGHGKSALLDAITWALWGQARKTFGTVKADQGLLRLGQTQMFVALDFIFNGQTYRVRREFAKTYGKPYTALDFGLLNPDTNELISLTDKTIRLTQDKIESLINLDAESFFNSAFLRQGQSNEFSKKSAKERKTLLATILGLNRYEGIRALALEKIKTAYTQKDTLAALQHKIEQDLQQKESILAELKKTEQSLSAVYTAEHALAEQKKKIEHEKNKLAEQTKKYELIQFQLQQLAHEQEKSRQELRAQLHMWRTVNRKVRACTDHKELEQRKRLCLEEISMHQQALQKHLEIKERMLTVTQALHTLEKQIKDGQTARIAEKKLQLDRCTLEHQLQERHYHELITQEQQQTADFTKTKEEIIGLQKKVLELTAHQIELGTLEKQFERRKDYYQKFVAQGTWVKQELDALEQRNKLTHDDNNPSCPLCEQTLTANRKRFLKKHFEQQEQFLNHRIQRLRTVSLSLKAILVKQHEQVVHHKKMVEQATAFTVKIDELTVHSTKLHTALNETQRKIAEQKNYLDKQKLLIGTAQQELDALHKQEHLQLQSSPEYQTTLAQRTLLDQELITLAYNQHKHQEAATLLTTLEQQLATYQTLQEEIDEQPQRAATIAHICTVLKKIQHDYSALQHEATAYTHMTQQLGELQRQENVLNHENNELRAQKEALLQQKGSLENQQAKVQRLEHEHKEQLISLKKLDDEITDFQAIATATGKDGIQALLIEESIPEIEQEANQLLAKLTGNQAQIFIESLRDLKSGGTKETLDIKISDNVGIRPYEMFSGGEAFRIDFALRIAISKLLARRAGTSLQTLIIDEGFGSQDEEGLSAIMDALYAVQEDFAKVIIVSHLPAMKDQFPVHFVIDKGPNGSRVEIFEQG